MEKVKGWREGMPGWGSSMACSWHCHQSVVVEAPYLDNYTTGTLKTSEENEMCILEAIEYHRGSRLLPVFWSNNYNTHSPFPGVYLVNTILILLKRAPNLALP